MLKLPDNLSDLLTFDAKTLVVTSRESKHREFKLDFFQKDMSDYTKTLAAFANADGGCIVFGIKDHPRLITGMTVSSIPDEARWADRLREDFAPEIVVATRTYEIGGKILLAIGTDPSPHRPIIARTNRTKKIEKKGQAGNAEVIRDGTIYYRSAGSTRTINYSELSVMLDERENNRIKSLMENLKVIEKIGVQNAGIVDMKEGASHLYLSKETARGLSFIDRGRFVEEEGAPAYVVLGNVDLNQVIHKPLEEDDKNLPTEVAKHLKPILQKIYGIKVPISAGQVTQILRHLGLLDDNVHSILEKKFKRRYVTRAGIKAIEDFVTSAPLEALRSFGSRAIIAEFEALS